MEKDTATPTIPQEENSISAVPQEEIPTPDVPKKEAPAPAAPKKEFPIISILAVLLVIIGIAELVFWSIAGFRVYLNGQEQKLWEEQQAAALAQSQGEKTGLSGGARVPQTQLSAPATSEEKRLSRLSVPWISYALADQEIVPGADPSQPRRSQLSVPRIPYDLAEQNPTDDN